MFRPLIVIVHRLWVLSLFLSRSSSSRSIVLKGRKTAVVGLPYEAICTIKSDEYNSTDLIFETDSGIYPKCCRKINSRFTEILNGTSARLHYPAFPSNFVDRLRWFRCYRTGSGVDKYADSDFLEISVKLPNTKPIIDQQSIVIDNWAKLSFVWMQQNENETEKQLQLNYTCYYKNDSNTTVAFRKGQVAGGRQCSINNPFRIVQPSNVLIVKIEGIAKDEKREIIETVSSGEELIILNQFVKPSQVNNFQVQLLESLVTVSFEPPKQNRNITYNIVVKCNKDLNDHAVNVTRELNCPPINDARRSNNSSGTHCRISKEFTDLPAFSNCTASVRAILVVGGIWSDWKRHDFETPEGIPRRNPEICFNCFSIRPGISDSVSEVIVYFSPLSEEEAQGKIILYKIRIFDKSFSNESFQYLNNTENSHYSFVLRNLSNHNDYEIGIEAKTSKGYNESLNMSSFIEISRSDDRFLSYLRTFNVTRINCTMNSVAVRTSWESDDVDCGPEKKIFLFWCEGEERSHTCKGVLNWATVVADSRSDIIVFSGGQRFIVGIGVRCDGKSTGVLWHHCSFNTAKCHTDGKMESCRGENTGFEAIRGPDSKRFIGSAEPEVATPTRSLSLVPVIAVSSATALCAPLLAAIACIKFRSRIASKVDRSNVSIVIPPSVKVSHAKIASCGSYQTSRIYDVSMKSDGLAASTFSESSQSSNTNQCILDHDNDDDACPEDSVGLPRYDSTPVASLEPIRSILPPITDGKVEFKSESSHLLPPTDSFLNSACVQDGQMTERQWECGRMKILSESFDDFVAEVDENEGSGAMTVETTSAPQLQESGYAFCRGDVPAVILPVPSGPAQPLSYEE